MASNPSCLLSETGGRAWQADGEEDNQYGAFLARKAQLGSMDGFAPSFLPNFLCYNERHFHSTLQRRLPRYIYCFAMGSGRARLVAEVADLRLRVTPPEWCALKGR